MRGARASAVDRLPAKHLREADLRAELNRLYAIRATKRGVLNLTRLTELETELRHRENVRAMHRAAYGYGGEKP